MDNRKIMERSEKCTLGGWRSGRFQTVVLAIVVAVSSVAVWELFIRQPGEAKAAPTVVRKSAAEKISELIKVQQQTNTKLDTIAKKLDKVEKAAANAQKLDDVVSKMNDIKRLLTSGQVTVKAKIEK